MRKKILTIGMAMALLFTGCGASKDNASIPSESAKTNNRSVNFEGAMADGEAVNSDEAYAEIGETYDDYGAAEEDMAKYDEVQESEGADLGAGGSSSNITDNNTNTTINTEKLIYHCDLRFDTLDYKKSISDLKKLIADNEGFIEQENESSNNNNYNYYYVDETSKSAALFTYTATIRVPSKKYDSFVNGTGNLGDLKNKNANVTNVSTEYYDLQAELKVYETKYQRYLDMLSKADKVKDIIEIENNITPLETRINQIKTRMNNINNDVAYSYVSVSIQEVKEYEVREEKNETFFQRLSREFKEATKDFGYRVQDFIIYLATHVFDLIIFIILAFIAWKLIVKKFIKKIKAKKGVPVDDSKKGTVINEEVEIAETSDVDNTEN
ncbi:MAG: DUF4349 domain-containing protein [Lachnospiraceae bacterium]|nr:DUF4349 domain-containing protein [Lachnospiraceae bacterium]